MRPRHVLGCVISDHDSSVCLLENGRLVACVNEERLCRVRRGDPRNSIRRALYVVLEQAGIDLNQVDAIFCDTDHYFPPGEDPVPLFPDYDDASRIYQLTHHLGHAASAFLPSPFDEAAFLTVDASGGIAPIVEEEKGKRYWSFARRELAFMDRGFVAAHTHPLLEELLDSAPGFDARNYPAESLSLGHAVRGEPLVEMADYYADASLGYFYALCSHFLDMEEGSFMGLAAHGEDGPMAEAMREVILLEPEGRIRIDKDAMNFWSGAYVLEDPVSLRRLSTGFMKCFGPGRKFFEEITRRHIDFAWAAQKRLEEALVHVASALHEKTRSDNLVIAGGVGLNSVANGVILRETPFKNIFVQPAASDDGLALGYALFGHYVLAGLPHNSNLSMGDACLGPDRDEECEDFLRALEQGILPVEYMDSLPFVEAVDILWKGRGEKSFRRRRMERVAGHRHRVLLPIRDKGGVQYRFEVRARDPQNYGDTASETQVETLATGSSLQSPVSSLQSPASSLQSPAYGLQPTDSTLPFEKFLRDHRDVAGVLDGERAFVGPEHVTMDPTNRCDNNCLACWTYSPLLGRYAPPEEWFKEQMPAKLAHRIVDELADMGTRRIRFTGGGEPFVHPAMIDLLTQTKERGMIAAVTTSFSALTSKKVAAMAQIGVDEITASIWAGTPDMYARSHPSKSAGTFGKIEALLRELCAAKKPHTRIYVANVLFSMNYMETLQMLDFALRVGADGVYYTVVDSVASPTDGLLLTPPHLKVLREDLKRVKERVEEVNQTRREPFVLDNFDGLLRRLDAVGAVRGDYDRHAVDAVPCTVGWIFCRIMPEGDVAPCCRGVDAPMGNLKKQSFAEIWHGPAYAEFRRMALKEKKSHPYFKSFGCYKSCDNLMHNEQQHQRIEALGEEEREHLRKHIVRKERS